MAKLRAEEHERFLRDKLAEQRHLLHKSIEEFVSGDLAEAVHLATIMRVLVHETGRNKPLLGQLNRNYLELHILDRSPAKEEKLPLGVSKSVVMSVPISVKVSNEGVFLNPDLDLQSYSPSILGKWWTGSSLILPGLGGFSRKEIVLGLANKEGGAHVDADLPHRYQRLMASQQLQIGWNKEPVSPLNLSRFMTAQSALELLDCLNRNFP